MVKKRLSKALAAAGIASRRACEEIIFEGRVEVNGQTTLVPQTLVDFENDKIFVDGSSIRKEEKKIAYVFNKPVGVICSSAHVGAKKIAIDFFPKDMRLFTVGRLDRDTSGLLIVTNDGQLSQEIIHPSKNIIKEYLVKTDKEITAEHLKKLGRGALIDKRWIRPVSVQKVRKGTFRVCVKEGKKHEVRILSEKAGMKVYELKRIRIGKLTLGTLKEGEYRPLTKKDKELLFA
jgi:23S rRNA pseudouridine2605 synthase